jgi:hypothetical protein
LYLGIGGRYLTGHWPLATATGRCLGQRQGHDRNVVDFNRLDDPAGYARRCDVDVFVDLLVELDEAPLAILAHKIANRDDRLVLAAHRVDIFYAVDLIQDLLQGRGDELFDFRGGMAREIDVDVGQGDDDLRIFLTRRQPKRGQAKNGREKNQNDRKIRFQEDCDDPVCETVMGFIGM